MKITVKRAAGVVTFVTLLVHPAFAEPTAGVGLSLSFDGGTIQTGVGVRLFSDNVQDSFVGSVGIDFIPGSKSWRGTMGAAHLGADGYFGIDLGMGINNGSIDIGIASGLVGTEREVAATQTANGSGENDGLPEVSGLISDYQPGPYYEFTPMPMPPEDDFISEKETINFPWQNNSPFPDF